MDSVPKTDPQKNPWPVAIAVMLSATMVVLDTTVVNVSLPHIAGSLSATVDEATWVLTSYLAASAVILPIAGWLANYFGRKRLLMTVVAGFTLSSALCGMAPSLPFLIFFRILQAITGGGLQPISQAVVLEEFPVAERGKGMAFWSLGIMSAPILGPTLGGWLTDTYSWRWVFYINLPIGIVSLVMISLFLSDPPYIRRPSSRVDFWGLAMLAVGIAALQIMLDKGQEEDWFSSNFIVALAITAAVLLPAFVIWELRIPEPIVHFRLLKIPTFAAGNALVAVTGFVLYGSLVLLPLFMQTLLGWTSLTAGKWTSPRGVGNAMCLPLVGYLLGRGWDGRWMLALGLFVTSLAFFGYSDMNLASGTWDILGYQINQGIGMALVFVPLTTLTMAPIPKAETGYATSLYTVTRIIGNSTGVSFVATWIARRSQFHQTVLAASVTPERARVREYLDQLGQVFMRAGSHRTLATQQAQAELYAVVQQQASLLSFIEVFRLMGLLFLASIPLVLLMRRAKGKREAPASR